MEQMLSGRDCRRLGSRKIRRTGAGIPHRGGVVRAGGGQEDVQAGGGEGGVNAGGLVEGLLGRGSALLGGVEMRDPLRHIAQAVRDQVVGGTEVPLGLALQLQFAISAGQALVSECSELMRRHVAGVCDRWCGVGSGSAWRWPGADGASGTI